MSYRRASRCNCPPRVRGSAGEYPFSPPRRVLWGYEQQRRRGGTEAHCHIDYTIRAGACSTIGLWRQQPIV